MSFRDDELIRFEAQGALPLPDPTRADWVTHDGARIWFATFGEPQVDSAVVLLHGGLGHSGNWGYQVPALLDAGYQPIVIDSRGHGRSTRDEQPYSYERMATDVAAVLDELALTRVRLVGWSDGAVVALTLAMQAPERVAGVFYFACNMDPSGTKPFEMTPTIGRCFSRHQQDYAALSATPTKFEAFAAAVDEMMATQPNASAETLRQIRVPVAIVQSEHDEFIWLEHAQYLAETIPSAELILLDGVTHFAPLQRPALFNEAMLGFLARL